MAMLEALLKYDPVEDFLRDLVGTPVTYVPNPGNAGDSLIATGTYQVLKRLGLTYDVAMFDGAFEHDIVVIGGGGNFVPLYREARFAIEKCIALGKRIVLLPHTVRGNEDILPRFSKADTIFCRDPVSYEHALRHTEARVYLGHDMAFHLDVEVFDHKCKAYTDMPGVLAKTLEKHPALAQMLASGEGTYMREDGERGESMPVGANADISTIFEFGVAPDNAEKSAWGLFQAVRSVKQLKTDRLHVGISSTLLSKPCKLLDNSYGKNAGIFYHSIRPTEAPVQLVAS